MKGKGEGEEVRRHSPTVSLALPRLAPHPLNPTSTRAEGFLEVVTPHEGGFREEEDPEGLRGPSVLGEEGRQNLSGSQVI